MDKPVGPTSARLVGLVKRLANTPRLPGRRVKVGHAGTLDPMASGVLLLLVGAATKQCETLMHQPKQYRATVRLGATTATDDAEAEPVPFPNAADPPTRERIDEVLGRFTGEIEQVPPIHSAIKVAGRRAYDLARSGETVELKPRLVRIDGLRVVSYDWPDLGIEIDCGRGFYVRSLARDLGQALNVGGHLTALRRTRVGKFHVDDSITPERLEADGVAKHLQSLEGDV